MKRFAGIVSMLIVLNVLSGCNSLFAGNGSQVTSEQQQDVKFSENILFSINNGAAGYGTMAECTDAEIFIYTDHTIKVLMAASDYESIVEIASFEMSDEDYAKLAEVADKEKIYNLQVKDGEAEDGSSYHITLYNENDQKMISKGGYMPDGEEFWETYLAIKEIIKPYGINEAVKAHRETLS